VLIQYVSTRIGIGITSHSNRWTYKLVLPIYYKWFETNCNIYGRVSVNLRIIWYIYNIYIIWVYLPNDTNGNTYYQFIHPLLFFRAHATVALLLLLLSLFPLCLYNNNYYCTRTTNILLILYRCMYIWISLLKLGPLFAD